MDHRRMNMMSEFARPFKSRLQHHSSVGTGFTRKQSWNSLRFLSRRSEIDSRSIARPSLFVGFCSGGRQYRTEQSKNEELARIPLIVMTAAEPTGARLKEPQQSFASHSI
jgi:hypothetical protein